MGLGLLLRAPLPRRGLERRSVSVADLWRQVREVALASVQRADSPLVDWYSSHADDRQLWLSFLPFEEDVELSLRDGFVEVSAKTSGAGPGYHEFLVELLDSLERDAGLAWSDDGEDGDYGDETGYRTERSAPALRAAMARQLSALASIVVDKVGAGALLNMSIGDTPAVTAFAASPLGEWSKEWFERAAGADGELLLQLAEEFLPWWETGLTARNLTKFGKALCWTAVRWVKPQTAAEEHAIKSALACFEHARRLGAADLPELEIAELLRLLSDEASPDLAPGPVGMGFRRRSYNVLLPGGWSLKVPGYFHEDLEDDGTTQVYWFGERTLRASALRFGGSKPPGEILAMAMQGRGRALDGLDDGLTGAVHTTRDEADACFLTHATIAGEQSLLSLSFAHQAEADREWAESVAGTARHRSPGSD
jgi:hypothetical protein